MLGSVAALARAIGVKPPTVHQWIKRERPVPIGCAAAIDRLTQGAVSRRDLRPDDHHLIWPELAHTDTTKP